MSITLPQDLLDIVGKITDTVRTGFQRSHVIGAAITVTLYLTPKLCL
jgi:hypothetical protein